MARFILAGFALLLWSALGCGSMTTEAPQDYKAQGNATFKAGGPVTPGSSIVFHGMGDMEGYEASFNVEDEGAFDGELPAGKYKVVVLPGDQRGPVPGPEYMDRQKTPIEVEIKADNSQLTIQVEKGP
jgi:hypothetical protein